MSAMCLKPGRVLCEGTLCRAESEKCEFRLAPGGPEIAAPVTGEPFCFSCAPMHPECTGCERCP